VNKGEQHFKSVGCPDNRQSAGFISACGVAFIVSVVASHLIKVEPENADWWINLAYATRRCESIEQAEAVLLRAREMHHDNALIEFNLACYASVTGRFEEAKALLQRAVELDKEIRRLALDDEDLKPLWD